MNFVLLLKPLNLVKSVPNFQDFLLQQVGTQIQCINYYIYKLIIFLGYYLTPKYIIFEQ